MKRTKEEIVEAIIETWEKFSDIDQSHFFTEDFRVAEDLLETLRDLVSENK